MNRFVSPAVVATILMIGGPVVAQNATSPFPAAGAPAESSYTPRLAPRPTQAPVPIPASAPDVSVAPESTLEVQAALDPSIAAAPEAATEAIPETAPPLAPTQNLATAVAELTTPETLEELEYQELDPASEQGIQIVAEVSAYLDGLDTMRGRFLQVASNGTSASGNFFLDRPGKARLEYDPPHPSLLVSDGVTVAHFDRELETMDRAPLRRTPLHLFLKRNVNLAKDTEIIAIVAGPGEIVLTANDPDSEMEGEVAFVFTAPSLELREWIVVDEFDTQVRVILSDIQHGVRLDPALFALRDERGERRGGGRR